jgi:hypothetical protein
MKTFEVFKHDLLGIQAVKIGFSWPAFFFGPIWMITKQLWGILGIWIGVFFVIELIRIIIIDKMPKTQTIIPFLLFYDFVLFLLWLVPPFRGNKWRLKNLQKKGFKYLKTIQAKNPDIAIQLLSNQAGF